jgi:hypothetical protein
MHTCVDIYIFFYHCLIWFIFHYYYYLRVLKSSLYLSSRPLVSIRVAANTRACSCWIQWFMIFNHLFHNCDLFLPWTYECFSSFTSIFNDLSLFDALYAICKCTCIYIRIFFCRCPLLLSVWLNMSEGHTSTVCLIITLCWSSYCSRKKSN